MGKVLWSCSGSCSLHCSQLFHACTSSSFLRPFYLQQLLSSATWVEWVSGSEGEGRRATSSMQLPKTFALGLPQHAHGLGWTGSCVCRKVMPFPKTTGATQRGGTDFAHYLTHEVFHWGIHKLCNVSSTVQKASTTWIQVKVETQILSSMRVSPMWVPQS